MRAGDVVTAVDRAAEEAVRDALLGARPDDGVLGEELPEHTGAGPVQWVVDPLDGTTNYIRRLPYFGTPVAARSTATELAGRRGVRARARDDLECRQRPVPTSIRVREEGAAAAADGVRLDWWVPGCPTILGHRRRQLRELGTVMAGYTDMRRFGGRAGSLPGGPAQPGRLLDISEPLIKSYNREEQGDE